MQDRHLFVFYVISFSVLLLVSSANPFNLMLPFGSPGRDCIRETANEGMPMHFLARPLSVLLLAQASQAMASDSYSGKVTKIQIVDTGTMQLRVNLDISMTSCDLNFAFVETSSSVFSLYSAGLVTAYSTGKTVSLQVNREASGYCRIFYADF